MAARQERTVIFAGAGASKAVNPSQFPTTVEFFDRLPADIHEDPLFQFVVGFLKSVEGRQTIDIEMVLWSLQTLAGFYASITKPSDIVGYSIRHNLMGMLFRDHNHGNLINSSGGIAQKITALTDKINEIVFELYAYEPTDEELGAQWLNLLGPLLRSGDRVDIFTTNYDTVIEVALETLGGDRLVASYQGVQGRRRRKIGLEQWEASTERTEGLLTKLHGSLDWKLQKGEIYLGDAIFTGDHSKQAIIYPGFKGVSKLPFFSAFHDYLGRAISQADHIVFLGFAFRDEHINDIIRNNMPTETSVHVINPDKTVQFPYARSRVHYTRSNFDSKSSSKVLSEMLI